MGSCLPAAACGTADASSSVTALATGWWGRSSTSTGSASDQFGRSVVPGMFGRRCSPTASSRVAASSVHGARASSRCAATTASSGLAPWSSPVAPASRLQQLLAPLHQLVVVAGVQHPLVVEVATGPQPGDRRQVVGADRRHRRDRPVGRVVVLEPQQLVRQQPGGRQRLPYTGLDGAEVLTDHDRGGAVALQRHDVEQVAAGIAHVRTIGRRPSGQHPPQPEQPHRMVDPEPSGAGDRAADGGDERLVAALPQPPRDQRRRAPGLPTRVEDVRRRAHLDPDGHLVLPRPRVRASAGDTDRQVLDDGQVPAGRLQLQVERPLQPRVEGDQGGVLGAEPDDRRPGRPAQLLRPLAPVGTVLVGERAPGGEVVQRRPLSSPPGVEAVRPVASGEDLLERAALEPPHDVPVDQRLVEEPVTLRGRARQVDPVGTRHVLHPQVERVAPPPRRGQVRARLLRQRGRDRVQRVDHAEAGARLLRPLAQHPQVGQVADAPARARPGGVQLDGETPAAPLLGEPAPARRHDQPTRAAVGAAQQVVAQREVGRQHRVDAPGQAVLALDLAGHTVRKPPPGPGHQRGPRLQVVRRAADQLAQGRQRLRRDGALLAVGVDPAGVDPPRVGGTGRSTRGPWAWGTGAIMPPGPVRRVSAGAGTAARGRRRSSRPGSAAAGRCR